MSEARCVVLLRGVNVGAHGRIAMPVFRSLLEDLGGTGVRTYLQSGNAVLEWEGSPDALAEQVHERLRHDLGLDVSVLVRTAAQVQHVVDANPFAGEGLDPKLLHAVFLGGPAPELDTAGLLPDRVVTGDGVLYVAYQESSHSSAAARLLSSKRFPVIASARNWRTVLALRDLAVR